MVELSEDTDNEQKSEPELCPIGVKKMAKKMTYFRRFCRREE